MSIETTGTRQLVAELCDRAAARSIRQGMTLAEANALCPGLQHFPHDPQQDGRALDGLARWMMRFTPFVSPAPPDAIFLDITGCQRLFGGFENLHRKVAAALSRLKIPAKIAIAPTPGAAWAIASYQSRDRVAGLSPAFESPAAPPRDLVETLSSLPPAALRLDAVTCAMLEQLGIETIGQLMKLPRDALPARFGTQLLQKLDAALGRIAEPLVPLQHRADIAAKIEFDGEVDSPEAIWLALRDLIGQIVSQLAARGCGARFLRAEFRRMYAPPVVKTIRLSRPSRSASNLFNLLRCAMEMGDEARRHIGTKARSAGRSFPFVPSCLRASVPSSDGFSAIYLAIPVFERIADSQLPLLESEEQAARDELTQLIEMLCARLGQHCINQPQLVESHMPERTCQTVSVIDRHVPLQRDMPARDITRPLRLLPTPAAITAVVSPSHDGDGAPISFTHAGQVHRLVYADGPERIAGMWWEGRNKTRDYFDAEDAAGRRFWVFRVLQTGKWFMHGEFS